MTRETRTPAALARALMAAGGAATLATLDAHGGPFASYVLAAQAPDGAPLMLLSSLAVHTRNLERDQRASLLLVREPEPAAEIMAASRLTLTGRCAKHDEPTARSHFLAARPDAAHYAGFADFSLYRFEIEAGHLVAGFGRIVGLTREELLAAA